VSDLHRICADVVAIGADITSTSGHLHAEATRLRGVAARAGSSGRTPEERVAARRTAQALRRAADLCAAAASTLASASSAAKQFVARNCGDGQGSLVGQSEGAGTQSDALPSSTHEQPRAGSSVDSEKVNSAWQHGFATPGGRAYYNPSDEGYSGLVRSAKKLKPYPGEYTCDMHGTPDHVAVGSIRLNAAELADLIRRDSAWASRPVRLFSCSTGARPDGFAQQLADQLGVPVTAPDMSVWANDRPPWVGEGVKVGGQVLPTAHGTWHRFDPRH
jgi:hypothetical protein